VLLSLSVDKSRLIAARSNAIESRAEAQKLLAAKATMKVTGQQIRDKLPRKKNDLAEIANAVSSSLPVSRIASLSVPLFLSLFLIAMTHSSLRGKSHKLSVRFGEGERGRRRKVA